MRHRKKGKILSRKRGPRHSLIRNLAGSLIVHERVITTVSKAKAVRPIVEKMVTRARRHSGALADRRMLLSELPSRGAVDKLIKEIAPRYRERKGGYLRITKLETRKGDSAHLAQIEFVK